ncbi:MAG: hypothetical protein IPL55_01535 [Saprospiraceae bacterium]|nr:hypothetical protein [Saprospiraceae bacterium]
MQVFNIFIIIQIFYIQSLYASITNPNGIFKGVIIISFTDEPSVKGLKNYLSHQAFRAAYTNGIIDEKNGEVNIVYVSLNQNIIISTGIL